MNTARPRPFRPSVRALFALVPLLLVLPAFAAGGFPPPGPTPTEVGAKELPPGMHLEIVSIKGGSKKGFKSGNHLKIKFKLTKDDGSAWDVSEMSTARILVSGPTFNYQRVIAELSDVATKSKWKKKDGTWNYTIKEKLPKTFLPPLNDSDSFGPADGELTGQPLVAGTYTVGMYMSWKYTVDGEEFQVADDTTADFLFGGATELVPREVVTSENCNQCHDTLQVHGGRRRSPTLCAMCHTAGAEDENVADAAGGTPGVSVDFRVMIHKLHNGGHLPSVLGVATNPDGSRNYDATPQPYVLVGHNESINDFSDVLFPSFPNFTSAMPKDLGYSALATSQKAQEDTIRTGITNCLKCHGDPDGDGPDEAPAQGDLYKMQPGQHSCGSCHDDLDYTKNYTSNGTTMPANIGLTAACNSCHPATGSALSVQDAHLHPLQNPALDSGLSVNVIQLTGGTGTGGRFLAGDSPAVEFSLQDDAGNDIGVSTCDAASILVGGPTNSRQAVMPYPGAASIAANPYDFSGRLASASSSGKGAMGKPVQGVTVVAETITVEFSSATDFGVTGTVSGDLGSGALPASVSTNPSGSSVGSVALTQASVPQDITVAFADNESFTVTGSVSGAMGSGALPAATSASTRFVSTDGSVAFIVSVGTTPFVTGNTVFVTVFEADAANPLLIPIIVGRTAFSGASPAPDRFYYEVVPRAATYTLTVPMDMTLEYLGNGNGAVGQALTAGNLPVSFGRQTLWEVTAEANDTNLSATAAPLGRYIDVSSTSGYAAGNTVAIDSSAGVGVREYAAVGWVESATRMWLSTPLRYAHNAGADVQKATLTFRQEGAGNQYTLDGTDGTVTSVVAFGNGNALVMTYRTAGRFGYMRHAGDTLQAKYVPPVNDSSVLGEDWGDWSGMSYVDGTYTASLWLSRNLDLGLWGEVQTYKITANAADIDFLYGAGSGEIEPQDIISSPTNCAACHDDLNFHGGARASLTACLMCHQPGSEDRAQYQANGAPPTTGVTVDFRTMLHKIHRGSDLAKASTYEVVGFGPPPDGFSVSTFENVHFPSMPGGVMNCEKCHGIGNDTWQEPQPRNHPTDQVLPTRVWRAVCNSCHDSDAVTAHIDSNTSPTGYEACEVCHGPDAIVDVKSAHIPR
jgi:OmcA/MtrC family decaheme c-type cytochrome